MKKRIALTGATGFIGGHLLEELLSNGYYVNAITRKPQQARKNVRWIEGNIENKEALSKLLEEVDVVINVAGLVKAKTQREFIAANSHPVLNLANAVKASHKNPHFIQVSSLVARKKNISNYAISKHQGEMHLKNNNLGIKWTIVRPPGVYGPNDNETLKIFRALSWRITFSPSNSAFRVSWIHVEDLVKAISCLMENSEYYNKTVELDDGNKNGYSYKEFYNTAAKILTLKPLHITLPKFILKIFGHTNDLLSSIIGYTPMVSAMKVNEMCHPDWVCQNNAEEQVTGWTPKYNLEKGLKETLDWYKKNGYM